MSGGRDRKAMDRKRNGFTPDEDDRLRELVGKYGENSWRGISAKMPRRNRRQCRERWFNYLSPIVCNGSWTECEENLLRRKVHEAGHKWRVIQAFFPGRTDINIKNQWKHMERVRMNNHTRCSPGTEKAEESFDQLIRSWLQEETERETETETSSSSVREEEESWMIWGDL
jgi:hypothetical protein